MAMITSIMLLIPIAPGVVCIGCMSKSWIWRTCCWCKYNFVATRRTRGSGALRRVRSMTSTWWWWASARWWSSAVGWRCSAACGMFGSGSMAWKGWSRSLKAKSRRISVMSGTSRSRRAGASSPGTGSVGWWCRRDPNWCRWSVRCCVPGNPCQLYICLRRDVIPIWLRSPCHQIMTTEGVVFSKSHEMSRKLTKSHGISWKLTESFKIHQNLWNSIGILKIIVIYNEIYRTWCKSSGSYHMLLPTQIIIHSWTCLRSIANKMLACGTPRQTLMLFSDILGPCLRSKIARKEGVSWFLLESRGVSLGNHFKTYVDIPRFWLVESWGMSFSKYFSSCSLFWFFCVGVIRERGNHSNHLNPCFLGGTIVEESRSQGHNKLSKSRLIPIFYWFLG